MKRLDRMEAYGRYLELLEAQHAALADGDVALFGALAQARDELAGAADRLPPAPDAAAAGELLGQCLELDSRMRERLCALRDDTRIRLRDMELRRPRLLPYLASPGTGARLDRVS